jgi:hypothetical protein
VHVVAVTRRLDVGQFRSMRAAGDRDAAQQRERAPRATNASSKRQSLRRGAVSETCTNV